MNKRINHTTAPRAAQTWHPRSGNWRQGVMIALAASLAFSSSLLAQTAPSQSPLLVGSSGARPNLMISLDNSGSMAFSFHETYGVFSDNDAAFEVRRCPATAWSDLSGQWIQGGMADFRNGQRCIFQGGDGNFYYSTTISVPYAPAATSAGNWVAQRSAQVNPIYYDPRVTYPARVGPDGNPLVPGDGITFVSNQTSANFRYQVFRNDANPAEIRTQHTIYASNPATGTGWTSVYNIGFNFRIPQHITYTAATAGTAPAFTYVTCNDVITVGGQQVGCRNWSAPVNIRPGNPATVPLPAGHNRTDCGSASCSNAQEITNIMNWYRYYLFRAPAVATAIGQALANPDYDDRIRVGYTLINERNNTVIGPNNLTPGATTDRPLQLRGVRMHRRGSAATAQIYTWLYDQDGTQNRHSNLGASATFNSTVNRRQAPYGGTPLHNTVDRVSNYYRLDTGVTEQPWRTNPTGPSTAANPEMTCRRSFNLLFSDGAWNAGTSTIAGQDFDNTNGPNFTRTLANGSTETFNYRRQGIDTEQGRRQYTPYPSTASGGLADLTARYFWHEDLRPLENEIQTRAGQPAFWQNMATYTVGYLIRPRGEVRGATSGLTFEQITDYQAQYAELGYGPAAKPEWATGNVNTAGSDQDRIDDFIQAGFTGGGRGFSATTADDVRRAFQIILSDIVNSTGRDAGVAVSSTGTDTSSIAGNIKYNVTYRTLDNSGNVIAQELDAQGRVVREVWNAQSTIPAPSARRVFTISGRDNPVNFSGNFSGLNADIQNALRAGPNPSRIPTNSNFIDYLRGADPVRDANDVLFRQRSEKMGSMVNPPSIYMGGDRDFRYDLANVPLNERVDGVDSYLQYVRNKANLPPSLYVATNAGQVHAFNALNGTEMAVYMPRRSLRRMLDYARDDYTFQYVLDGPISEHDIYDGTNWNHLAVGSGGRGERLIYALRAPLNTATTTPNREPGQMDFVWETGPEDINVATFAMGYTTQPARSGQTENGEWVVLVNSGHHNGFADGTRHGLLVLNALTGEVIRRIGLPAGYSAGRGLSGVTVVRDVSKRIVAAYAGDANGNLWRFNLRGTPANWSVSYGRPLFTTPNNRPIYGAPAWQVSRQHDGGTVVMVATGMLIDDADIADTANSEYLYGIWDPTPIGEDDATGFTTRLASQLLTQSFISTSGELGPDGVTYYQTTRERYDATVHRGWRLELRRQVGERNIDQVRNLGPNVLVATTVIAPPADPNAEMCRISNLPTNYLYVLDANTGAMPRRALDSNGDGRLDAFSVAEIATGGYARGLSIKRLTTTPDPRTQNPTDPGGGGGGGGSGGGLPEQRACTDCGNDGEGDAEGRCRSTRAAILGTEDGSIGAGGTCEVGWTRSQYQLSGPPRN